MIKNKLELEITKESLKGFLSTLQNMDLDDSYKRLSNEKKIIYRKAVEGEIENLQNQIKEYELLCSGNLPDISSEKITDLPLNLIRIRIAKGYTWNTIAEKLSMDAEEYADLEENLFDDAEPSMVLKLIDVLDIDIPSELKLLLTEDPEKTQRNIRATIDYLYNILNPIELKEKFSVFNGYIKLYDGLKKIFNVNLGDIITGSSISYEMLTNVRYKAPKRVNKGRVFVYTSFAEYLAKKITDNLDIPSQNLTTNPLEFREKVIKNYGELNFQTCVAHLWDIGIPVLPLEMSGGFHGACMRYNGNNVIILKQQSRHQSRWLFDLLHEYWHSTQEPQLLERKTIDIGEILTDNNEDQEEIDANKFAENVIFDGRAEELFEQCFHMTKGRIQFMKKEVQRIALMNDVDVGCLANFVAYKLAKMGHNWWGAAYNLQSNDNPFDLAKAILEERLDHNLLINLSDPVDREIIKNSLYKKNYDEHSQVGS